MIAGVVSSDDTPRISLLVADTRWTAIVDTGFNGDLELPIRLKKFLHTEYLGTTKSFLAGGRSIEENNYSVKFPFDGRVVDAEATFVASNEILIGTHLIRSYRLEIDFPGRTVVLQHADEE